MTDPRVISVNVGTQQQIALLDRPDTTVLTSIFKSPVAGRVAVRRHNIVGDRQSDLKAHGGPNKAVYGYPSEHYRFWTKELPDRELPWGVFGENLTTEGLSEETIRIGDRFRIGSAVLQVTQPRMPCFKLGIRFDRPDMIKRFWSAGRPGMYLSIIQEGDVEAGDPVEKVALGPEELTVFDVVRLYRGDEKSVVLFDRAMRAPLSGSWKQGIRERLIA